MIASLTSFYLKNSVIQSFTTPEVIVNACGAAPAPPVTASTVPLPTAMASQYWQVGDFSMQVREVRGGDGVFSGWGVMSVPYLSIQIPVKFEGVWVDEDYHIVQGEVIALSEGLEGFQERWQDEHSEEDESGEEGENASVADGAGGSDNGQGSEEVSTVAIEGEVVQVYVNEAGQVIAVDEEGNEVVADEVPKEGEALVVQDSQGNSFTVDSGGEVRSGNASGSSTPINSDVDIEQKLIKEVLKHFKEEINTFLENKDKGPLDKALVKRMLHLPDCLSGNEEELNQVMEKIDYYTEHRNELLALIEADENNKNRFHALVNKLNGKSAPYQEGLTEEEWDELIAIVCPHLLPSEEEAAPEDAIYDFFVTDDDAWYRESEAPYKAVVPKPRTNVLAKALQVSVLEVVQDEKGKNVAKVKLKDSDEIAYTSLSNLTQVKRFSEDRTYKFIKDHSALKIPFAGNSADKTYKNEAKVMVEKYLGDYVKVKGTEGEVAGHWVAKTALIWTDLIDQEAFLAETQTSTTVATKFVGNTTSVACNICVRSALYLLKEDAALFPTTGSEFNDPADSYKRKTIKGYVSDPGQAKSIKQDFDVLSTKADLSTRFTEIEKHTDEGWEAYFQRLQDKADQGGIVIGTMLNSSGVYGHVMMITPGGLVDVLETTNEWGSSYLSYNRNIKKVPRVLECGSGARENEAPLCRNVDYIGATIRLKWFIYEF